MFYIINFYHSIQTAQFNPHVYKGKPACFCSLFISIHWLMLLNIFPCGLNLMGGGDLPELLHRWEGNLSNGETSLNRPLHVRRSCSRTAHSTPSSWAECILAESATGLFCGLPLLFLLRGIVEDCEEFRECTEQHLAAIFLPVHKVCF